MGRPQRHVSIPLFAGRRLRGQQPQKLAVRIRAWAANLPVLKSSSRRGHPKGPANKSRPGSGSFPVQCSGSGSSPHGGSGAPCRAGNGVHGDSGVHGSSSTHSGSGGGIHGGGTATAAVAATCAAIRAEQKRPRSARQRRPFCFFLSRPPVCRWQQR